MKNINLSKFFIIILPRFSIFIFMGCVLLSMYLYKGGIYHMVLDSGVSMCPGASCTDDGHWTSGYLFFKNFLSDFSSHIIG